MAILERTLKKNLVINFILFAVTNLLATYVMSYVNNILHHVRRLRNYFLRISRKINYYFYPPPIFIYHYFYLPRLCPQFMRNFLFPNSTATHRITCRRYISVLHSDLRLFFLFSSATMMLNSL